MKLKLARSPYGHLLDDPQFRLWVENLERGSAGRDPSLPSLVPTTLRPSFLHRVSPLYPAAEGPPG